MPTKALPLLDYLVSTFQAADTLGAATPPVTVLDGPVTEDLDDKLKLYVGLTDPDSDAAEEAAIWTQTRIDLNTGRREDTTLRLVAEVWTGEDTPSIARASCQAIVDAAETLVRDNDDQFGGNATFVPMQAASYTLTQNNTQMGAICRISFDLTFQSFT